MTDSAGQIAQTIISHLKTAKQLELLPAVVEALKTSPAYRLSHHRVVLTSAAQLEPPQLESIKHYLASLAGKSYDLVQLIDPTLVAGFTLQVNDTFIDASLIGKINTVQNQLTAKE